MIRRPPRSTRTDTLFPSTTLFRSRCADAGPARGPCDPQWPCSASAASARSEEHTSELQSLMRISYAVFFFKKKTRFTGSRLVDDADYGNRGYGHSPAVRVEAIAGQQSLLLYK